MTLVLAAVVLVLPSGVWAHTGSASMWSMLRNAVVLADSVAVADSIKAKKEQKDAIDAPVFYEANDSMVWSRTGNAFLYGSGKVQYDKIELTADIIKMNMDSSVVHATGSIDTAGVSVGLPIFKDGGTPY